MEQHVGAFEAKRFGLWAQHGFGLKNRRLNKRRRKGKHVKKKKKKKKGLNRKERRKR